MRNSIFTDDFPSFSTQKELDTLIAMYPTYDPYYVVSGSLKDRRELFDKLYQTYSPYADSNFLKEVKTKFHQRTWEMYLACALIDRGVPISPNPSKGPDILIETESKKVWIECVACTPGSGPDKVPPLVYGVVGTVPENQMLLRLASVLEEKYRKYQKYLENGVVAASDIFIIAINSADLSRPDGVIPLILKNLFAIGHPTISIPINGGKETHSWSRQEYIEKENASKVSMQFFIEQQHAGVSGVLYCNNNILNHPPILGADVVSISNPIAENPFPKDLLGFFKGFHFDVNQPEWVLEAN